MQPRKRLQGLATALPVVMVLAVPTVAWATPQWRVNGVLAGGGLGAGNTPQESVEFGTLTLKSTVIGEIKCKIVAGAPVWNESEKGLNAVEGLGAFPCTSPECKGQQPVVTAENPLELIEETVGSEKQWKAKRGLRTLPWPGELFETTEKTTSLNVHRIKITTVGGRPPAGLGVGGIVCPAEGLEVVYEGNLEPKVKDGVKNGMSPSKLVFEGEGGKTGSLLCTPVGPPPCGSLESGNLFVSGELTILGAQRLSVQLITAR